MSAKACIKEILLSEYLDGELPVDAVKYIREHLAGCRKCRAAYERMKADRSLLLECLPDPAPPAHLKLKLLRKIDSAQEDSRHFGILARIGRPFTSASRALAFAAACVVFLAVVVSGLQVQRHFENKKILAEIDRSGAQWAAQDFSLNPFDIQGAKLQVTTENPFKSYLNER
jgi:anti-sigma factor RsiW